MSWNSASQVLENDLSSQHCLGGEGRPLSLKSDNIYIYAVNVNLLFKLYLADVIASDAPPLFGNINSKNCTKGLSIRQFGCLESESFS